MPKNKDAANAAGSSSQAEDGNGDSGNPAAESTGLTEEAIELKFKALRDEMHRGIAGATKKTVSGMFESEDFTKLLSTSVAQAMKTVQPKAEAEAKDKYQSQIDLLTNRLNESEQAASEATERAKKQALESGVQSIINSLDGSGGRPAIKADARGPLAKLINDGYQLPSAPVLGEGGEIVVEKDGVPVKLLDFLSNGYFTEDHWAKQKYAAKGSGSSGSKPASGGASSSIKLDDAKTLKEQRAVIEAGLKDNPEGTVAALQKRLEEKKRKFGG